MSRRGVCSILLEFRIIIIVIKHFQRGRWHRAALGGGSRAEGDPWGGRGACSILIVGPAVY